MSSNGMWIRALCLLALGLLEGRPAAGSDGAPVATDRIGRIAWLQGCWESASPRRTIEEAWSAPRGGSMIGTSRTISADTLRSFEFLLLRESADSLVYEARPSGQAAAAFAARTVEDSVVVFENAAHDFPQRIGYRRAGADSLYAWIEGVVSGELRRVDFRYRRAPCEGTR